MEYNLCIFKIMTKPNNKQNADTTQDISINSEQDTTNVLQSLTEGCFQLDANSLVTFWNKKAEDILSVSRGTVIGKNFWEVCKNTLSTTLLENFHKAVDTNLAVTFETYAEQPNLWLEVSAIPSVNGLFVYLKNISERKIALQQLQNERQKYDDLFNRSPVPQWVYEIQGFKFLDVNEAAILHYGYSRAEFLTMTIKDIRPKEEIPAMLSICARLVPGYFSTSNVKHQKKNGEIIIVTVEGNSIRFGDENARLVTVIDRTLEIKNSEALKTSVDRYNTVSKATSDAIWDWDMVTNEMIWNHGIKDLFGHPKIKYTDSWWQEHIHPDDLERVLQKFELAISSKKNRLKIEYQFRKANGSYRVVLDRAYISYSKGGIPIRAIGSMQDITDQVATLKALELKNERLREITWIQSNKVKDPLMKLMSIISLMNLNNTDLVAINEMIPFLKHLGSQLDVAMKEIVEKSSLSS
jgi:PAS domain S-box-containing protein